jgi:hypothetical protein
MAWLVRTCQGFAEVLVMGNPLREPAALPPRYASRARQVGECDGTLVYFVQSAAYREPVLLDRASIECVGMWIVPADAIPAGGLEDEGVPAMACVFGLSLAAPRETLQRVCSMVQAHGAVPPALVLYHGTSAHCWSSIAAEGLRPSYGMLGSGVYLGSFWKATRFAARSQDYVLRKEGGCVARVYVFSSTLLAMPALQAPAYVCGCTECTTLVRNGSAAALERAAHTDHQTRWAHDPACDGVFLEPRRCAGDARQWIVRNAEWCLRSRCLRVQNGARLRMDTVIAERYEPLQRNQMIA